MHAISKSKSSNAKLRLKYDSLFSTNSYAELNAHIVDPKTETLDLTLSIPERSLIAKSLDPYSDCKDVELEIDLKYIRERVPLEVAVDHLLHQLHLQVKSLIQYH